MSEYDAQQLDMLEPAYLARFDLTQPPFSPALDERFFYLDADRAQLLDLLRQLIQSDESLLIVGGERGAGKTSLLQYFVRHANESWRICQVDAHAMMDADQLLWRISQGFGIGEPSRDPAVLQGMLYEHMAALHRGGMVPILVVDNAHELPVGALEALFHLADTETADGGRLLLTILFCEPQIETLLDSPTLSPLRAHVGHTLEMPRLSTEQTAGYLQHRLNAAGRIGDALFSLKDIRRIQKSADGLPGRINEQAHRWLNKRIGKSAARAPSANMHTIRERWFLIVGLGVVAVAAILVFHRHLHHGAAVPDTATTLSNGDQAERQLPLSVPPSASTTSALSRPLSRRAAKPAPAVQPAPSPPHESARTHAVPVPQTPAQTDSANGSTAPKHAKVPVTPATAVTHARTRSSDSAAQPAPSTAAAPSAPPVETLSLSGASPNPVPASPSPQHIVLNGHGFTPQTRVSVTDAVGRKHLSASQFSVESDSRLVLHVPTGGRAQTWTITVNDPGSGQQASMSLRVVTHAQRKVSAAPAPAAASAFTEPSRLHADAWLLARNPTHFTLQLLSTRTPAAIATFVRQQGLSGDLARFDTMIEGVRWNTLVRGDYADRAAALAAAQQLPASLHGPKPWVRSFGDIQKAIHASQSVASSPAPRAALPPPDIPSTDQGPASAHDVSWLWNQDPNAYTLQLFATHTQANVAAFIKAHQLHGKVVYFHARHAGQDWYTLVYGVYPDRADAVAAIKQLPPELRNANPWARSYASVQAALSPTASPSHP